MGKYLGAECYKACRRKDPYIFLAVILALAAFFMLLLRVEGAQTEMTGEGMVMVQRASVQDLVNILCVSLSMGLYLLLSAGDIVFSDQYKNNTLKNEVSYGISRSRIYLGKLIASAMTAVTLCVLLIGGYLVLSLALFPAGEELGESLQTLGLCLAAAFPLWMGGLGLFLFLQFTMKSTATTLIIYVMVVGFLGSGFLDLMAVFLPSLEPVAKLIQTVSLSTPFSMMRDQGPAEVMGYAWGLGMAWLGLSTVGGLLCFRKKEIS